MNERDELARYYANISANELLELHASGKLTKLAYEVIELELAKRDLEKPEPTPSIEEEILSSHEYWLTKKTDHELLDMFTSGYVITSKEELDLKNSLSKEMAARGKIVPASSYQRLGNYIIDLILVYLIYSLVLMSELDVLITTNVYIYFFLVYYIIQEWLFGWTIGKLITGTRVASQDGTALTIGLAALRTVLRLLPIEAFSFVGRRPRGWHDSISKTIVVSIRK